MRIMQVYRCAPLAPRRTASRRAMLFMLMDPCWCPSGSISVRTQADAVVLAFRHQRWGDTEWQSVEQRVALTWTACHLGGRRPWFSCPAYTAGRCCGRRVAVLYLAGKLFACRRCHGLAYESQQESLWCRG